MAGVDAILLARIQFGVTVGFHIVLPAMSIGLASYPRLFNAFEF